MTQRKMCTVLEPNMRAFITNLDARPRTTTMAGAMKGVRRLVIVNTGFGTEFITLAGLPLFLEVWER